VAEELLMIEREIRDSGNGRMLDDVGRVQAAAEPDFEDAGIRRRAREGENRRGGRDFEKARFGAAAGVQHFGEQSGQRVVVNQSARDPDPFIEANEVGAREGVDRSAAFFQRRAKEGDGRALSVGARDVEYGRKRVLRSP